MIARDFLRVFPSLVIAFGFSHGISTGAKPKDVLPLLRQELRRNFAELKGQDSLPPYFLAYRVNDSLNLDYSVNKGGVILDHRNQARALNVEVRVGSPTFDNTHPLRENLALSSWTGFQDVPWPLEQNPAYEKKSLRMATDYAYRAARDQFVKIRANVGVRPAEGDTGLDFASAKPVRFTEVRPDSVPPRKALDTLYHRLLRASDLFRADPHLYASQIDFNFNSVLKRMASSDGTVLAHRESLGSISIYVETKADDGMILWLSRDFHFRAVPLDFSSDTLNLAVHALLARLDTLRRAPVMETYAGPVILENLAAGVFVHEVFGHRVEGHRQKAVDEGQTFVSKVGQTITNSMVSIVDDPTLPVYAGHPLNGFYRFDDEGVKSQRTVLIENGVFRNFLLSRSVLFPQGESNGHGRANLGLPVVARMGNTLLTASRTLPFAGLRDSLMSLLRSQRKPYGLILHDISGGFTVTTRDLPQTFRVEPLYVTRVFADGRPDEIVRGVDAVGTPLSCLGQIAAAGNDPDVFNGHCGAESGWVPVSASSPSLLLYTMEFETRAKDQNLAPILAPPRRVP